MQIIKKAKSRVDKAWGKQKIKDTAYRLLKYTLINESGEGILLQNAVTGELVRLEAEEKAILEMLPITVKSVSAPDSQSIPAEPGLKDKLILSGGSGMVEPALQQTVMELIEKHFLVPTDYDEQKTVGQLRHLLTMMQQVKDITGYTILPTTYCNARCFYCYECNFKHVHMTEERAHDVVEYIISHSHGKKVSLQWFGGEPLVGMKIISLICRELTDKGVEFTSSMISNGALFDQQVIEEARDLWKLKSVQITIDGTEDVYNQVKDYINMKGSPYQQVLGNIRALSEAGIRVSIRINLGFHNVDDTENLIKELSDRFTDCENVSMYVHELFENEGTEPTSYTEEQFNYLTDMVGKFNAYAAERGKYIRTTSLPSLALGHCMADNDGSVIIHPGGELTKCEHFESTDNFGTIYSDDWDKDYLRSWKEHAQLTACESCVLYPSCIMPVRCPDRDNCVSGVRKRKIEEVLAAMTEAETKKKEKDAAEASECAAQTTAECDSAEENEDAEPCCQGFADGTC